MTLQAVLFDLDGTLADTALDLGGALNALLERHGFPQKQMEDIRPVASHGASGLILLGAGISKEHPEHARWRQEYLAEYERCFDRDTVLFDGINELIRALDERGLKWGIITNKPKTFTDRLVPKLGFAVPPATVVSGDTCAEAKPQYATFVFVRRDVTVGVTVGGPDTGKITTHGLLTIFVLNCRLVELGNVGQRPLLDGFAQLLP